MNKRKILIIIIFSIFAILFFYNNKTYAANLDEIVDYTVTVDPRMTDGSLDITYEITWKILDSTTEGPLEWVTIGTPNSSFDTPTAITNNIKSIKQYNGAYVRIDFKQSYKKNEQVTFKYSIHQSKMYKLSWGKCKYEFTPAWFTTAEVDNLTIRWNSDKVKSSSKNSSTDGNYLVWNKKNMSNGEKLTINIKYDKDSFSSLSKSSSSQSSYSSSSFWYSYGDVIILFIVIIVSIAFRGVRRIL